MLLNDWRALNFLFIFSLLLRIVFRSYWFFIQLSIFVDYFELYIFQVLDAESITNLRTAAATAVATKVIDSEFFQSFVTCLNKVFLTFALYGIILLWKFRLGEL